MGNIGYIFQLTEDIIADYYGITFIGGVTQKTENDKGQLVNRIERYLKDAEDTRRVAPKKQIETVIPPQQTGENMEKMKTDILIYDFKEAPLKAPRRRLADRLKIMTSL